VGGAWVEEVGGACDVIDTGENITPEGGGDDEFDEGLLPSRIDGLAVPLTTSDNLLSNTSFDEALL